MASERKFVTENIRRVLLKEYLMKETDRAGFGGLDIQRTPMGTRVTLIAERPGLVIGRKGDAIKQLTKAVEEGFSFDNPQIEVQEVENPNLNAQIMAEKLASALERGWHFRRAGHSSVRRIMDAGARGCQIKIAGKLTGQRHRTEKFTEGTIKYCGETALIWMERGFSTAQLKPGSLGITVHIMHPKARLPDEVNVAAPVTAAEKKALKEIEKAKEKAEEAEAKPEAKPEKEKKPKKDEKKAEEKTEKKPEKEKTPKKEEKEAPKKEEEKEVSKKEEKEAHKKEDKKAKPDDKKADEKKEE